MKIAWEDLCAELAVILTEACDMDTLISYFQDGQEQYFLASCEEDVAEIAVDLGLVNSVDELEIL